jgi:polyisoprenoid-binding protein YceI
LSGTGRWFNTGASSVAFAFASPTIPNMKTLLLLLPAALALFTVPVREDRTSPVPPGDHDWVVDPVHSSVVFRIKHANASWFQGTFDMITGQVTLDPSKPEAGSVALTIPLDSIDTNDKKRDDHLKAPEFFNAKENPSIAFASTKIAKKGDTQFEVTGDLQMAGKKKSITMTVEKTGVGEMEGKLTGWMTTFTIKRSDFGVSYGVDKGTLCDEVTLTIALETKQKK